MEEFNRSGPSIDDPPVSMSILVVDDEVEVCEFLSRFLIASGHKVRAIHDPTAAISELERAEYDLILLDLSMPGMSGIDLLKALRETGRATAAAIITGNPSIETAVESIAYGVSAYLRKPFTLDELRDVLRRISEKAAAS